MSEGIGYLAISGVAEESTVNTAVNATQRLPYLEFSPDVEFAQLMNESLQGQVAKITPDLGMRDIRGAWRCYDTYTLSNLLLKSFFGTLSAGAYTFDTTLVGKSLTWAIDKTVSIWELSGLKINQLVLSWGADGVFLSGTCIAQGISFHALTYTAATISAAASDNSINDSAIAFPAFNPGDKITIAGFTGTAGNNGVATVVSRTTAKIIISGITLTDDAAGESVTVSGAANTAAELAALLPSTAKRVKIAPDMNVRLGVATAALGIPEEINITEGSLTITRPMAETHQNGTRGIREPSPDNFVEGIVELTLPRYTTNQYKLWQAVDTRLSLRLYFDEEGGTGSQEWIIPNIILTAAPNPVSGPGFIPQTIAAMLSIGQDIVAANVVTSFDTTDDSINTTAANFPMVYPGGTIFVSGATNAANNGVHTIVSRTASKIIVTTNLTTELAGASITIVTRNPFVRLTET